MSSTAKKSATLSNDEKLALCEYAAAHPSMSQRALCVWAQRTFDLTRAPSQATISNVLKKRDALRAMAPAELAVKRPRYVKHPELDRALANWVLHTLQHSAQPVSGNAIKKKASKFAALLYPHSGADDLVFSNGWLDAFKERHGLKGHAKRAKEREVVERSLPELQQLTAAYAPRDVYAFDEFGLFYDLSPDWRIAASDDDASARNRLTLAVCVNGDGTDARAPLVVGRTRHALPLPHGVQYESNAKASMSELVFQKWLTQFDAAMRDAGRRVLLLLDTAATHVVTNLSCDSVHVAFLPAHGAHHALQPLHAGVIAAFKRRYRLQQLAHALDRQEQGAARAFAVDQCQAIEWCAACWHALSPELIAECWHRTQLLAPPVPSDSSVGEPPATARRKSRDEQEIESDVSKHIEWLGLANPRTVSELLSPEDEDNVHPGVEDEDFVGCAIQRECASEGGGFSDDGGIDDDVSDAQTRDAARDDLSDEQKLQHISYVLRFLSEYECESSTATDLRKAQRALREKVAASRRVARSVAL